MDYTKYNQNMNANVQPGEIQSAISESKKFMLRVYNWMAIGLALTAAIAYGISQIENLRMIILQNSFIIWGAIILQFVVVIALTAALNKIPSVVATIGFLFYSALTGVVFSMLFLVYTKESITTTFLTCSAMFGAISLFGYITKRDLSGVGSFMFMGLFGLIIASIINIFVGSSTLYWMISYAGVLIFVGLTAYDTQKIKKMSESMDVSGEAGKKAAIFGALNLYLDFINLFLFLLRIMGDRK